MKKLLFILLLLPSLSWGQETMVARNTYYLGAGTVAAAACSASAEQSSASTSNYVRLGYDTVLYHSTMFTPAGYALCKVGVDIRKDGTGAGCGNITVYIYDNNPTPSDRPGSVVATMTDSAFAASGLETSYALKYVDFSNYSLTASTKYWIVVKCDGAGGDTTNYIRWQIGAAGRNASSADGATWSPNTLENNFETFAYK